MGDKVLKIGTVHQCNCCLGSKTLNPLVSVIDLSKADLSPHTDIKFGFYTILLSECKCEAYAAPSSKALPRIRLSWFRRRRERRIKVSGKDVGGIWNSLILSVCAMGWRKLISLLLLSPIGEERQCMEIRNMNVA